MNEADIIFIIIENIVVLLIIALINIHSWLSIIRPDWYNCFRIFENGFLLCRDHLIFLPLKGYKDSYDIDKSNYDKKGSKPYLNSKGIWTWDFEKGKNQPLTFRENIDNFDGKFIKDMKSTGNEIIDDIVAGEPTIEDFLKTWGVVIVGIILVAMIGFLITKNQESSKFTTELLINLTRK